MSLAETQQIFQLLTEIHQLLSDIELKADKLQREAPQTRRTLETFKELERVALRYMVLVRRLGLPKDAEQLIRVIMRIIVVFRQMQIAGTLAFAGPVGLILAVPALLLANLSLADTLAGY